MPHMTSPLRHRSHHTMTRHNHTTLTHIITSSLCIILSPACKTHTQAAQHNTAEHTSTRDPLEVLTHTPHLTTTSTSHQKIITIHHPHYISIKSLQKSAIYDALKYSDEHTTLTILLDRAELYAKHNRPQQLFQQRRLLIAFNMELLSPDGELHFFELHHFKAPLTRDFVKHTALVWRLSRGETFICTEYHCTVYMPYKDDNLLKPNTPTHNRTHTYPNGECSHLSSKCRQPHTIQAYLWHTTQDEPLSPITYYLSERSLDMMGAYSPSRTLSPYRNIYYE